MTTTLRYDLIFVNLPVADLARSRAFFTALGYEFDDRMCNDDGLALVLGPTQDVILLRDVLAFSAAEVAETLGTSVASVNSALQRGRATVGGGLRTAHQPASDQAVNRFVAAARLSMAHCLAQCDGDLRFTHRCEWPACSGHVPAQE